MTFSTVTFVLGGVRSGKSAFAEQLVKSACANTGGNAVYIASAQAHDDEMSMRIQRHRTLRGDGWNTVEEPMDVAGVLDGLGPVDVALFDCATLWLTNQLLADTDLAAQSADLCEALGRCSAPVVVVSNEVGLGGIGDNVMARKFADAQGELNQNIAALADLVVLVTAGLPLVLKGSLPPGVT